MTRNNHFQALLLVSLFTLQCLVPPSAATCAGTSSAVISALLPLHTGADCRALQLRGLQQLAALRAVVSDVNNDLKAQDGLTLGLQVQDTCSTPQGAMSAALRSLVDAQQTCTNPPLYLGMVGPEDAESLAKVKAVSRVFNATHVLPNFLTTSKESEDDTVFHVSIEKVKEQAQSVLAVLRQLGWHSFSLAFEEPMAELAEVLLKAAKEDGLCPKGSVTRLNLHTPTPNIFSGNHDGVVVLAENHQMAARVLQNYQALTTPLVLLVRTVGLESWQIPRSGTHMYLLQQISAATEGVPEALNNTLKAQYEAQRQAEFQNVHCKDIANAADCAVESSVQDNLLENIDVSVSPMAHGVRLMGAALRAVHRARCLSGSSPTFGMCPKLMALPTQEWRNALRRATVITHNLRIRFLMEISTTFNVYTRDNNAGDLIKVAALAGGTVKELVGGYKFPQMVHASNATSCGAAPAIPAALPPPKVAAPPPPAIPADDSLTLKDLYTSEYSFYELVGMICGVGFIMFAVMIVIIYLIYNNLVEKGEKESTGGSMETVRSSRPPRRKFRDTFRRNSSTRESNRS